MRRHARSCLPLAVLGLLGWGRPTAAAHPAVLYVPAEEVTLVPLSDCPIFQSLAWEYNAALGCGGVAQETMVPPYDGDPDALLEGLRTALEPYDVHVTDVRPPAYVPYSMLLPGGAPEAIPLADGCASTAINCGAHRRNRIAFTDTSGACADADPLRAALRAFGRMSGLERVDDPDDPMGPPDGEGVMFQDRCSPIETRLDEDGEPLPGECGRPDHLGCDEGFQNAHHELLAVYGPRRRDTEPPVIEDVRPEDDLAIPWPELAIEIDARITDEDPFIALRWSFDAPGVDTWFMRRCTNNACYRPFELEVLPTTVSLIAVDPWTVTLEASDLHGNVAEPVVRRVTLAGPPPLADPDGTGTDTGDEGGTDTTDQETTETTQDEPPDAAPDRGCGCSQRGRDPELIWGVMLVVLRRRADRARDRSKPRDT